VIISDDASTDHTAQVVQTWLSHPHIHYRRNICNLGRVANYHKAISDYAHGEWVVMLDGDDFFCNSSFISLAWQKLQEYDKNHVVFVQAGQAACFDSGQRAGYLKFVFSTGFFSHLGTLFNRRLAILNACYSVDIQASDMEFLLRMALTGNVLILNTLAGCWRLHKCNASSNLSLSEIAPNVCIYRQLALLAVQQQLITMKEIDTALSCYEGNSLWQHFCQTFINSGHKLSHLPGYARIVFSVNPRLFLMPRFYYQGVRTVLEFIIKRRIIDVPIIRRIMALRGMA
jgi:glycosyltransferase involved in cell wall biosynthesis